MLPEVIKTERLLLRPYKLSDIDDVLSYAMDEEWGRYLPVPQPYGRGDAEKFIASQVLLDRSLHSSWAIEHKGIVIGGINIRFKFEHRVGEFGYSIAKRFWGRGFATDVSSEVINAAFNAYPDLNRIRANADARNVASIRVLEKLDMTREGTLRQNRVVRGEPVDEVWFGILRSEWCR